MILQKTVDVPIFVGSGVKDANADQFRRAGGVIVGTSIKRDGDVANPVDAERLKALVSKLAR